MDLNRTILFSAIAVLSFYLYTQWLEFSNPKSAVETTLNSPSAVPSDIPQITNNSGDDVPTITNQNALVVPGNELPVEAGQKIKIETDLIVAEINLNGGSLDALRTKEELENLENPSVGYPLLKSTPYEKYLTQSGIIGTNGQFPNHKSIYKASNLDYKLADSANEIVVPITWQSETGQNFTKIFRFKRDSYVVGVEYQTTNSTTAQQDLYLYAQFLRSKPLNKKSGGMMAMPIFMGGTVYTPEDKYQKISFDDIEDENLIQEANSGWIGMLQHYFSGIWIPENSNSYEFYSRYQKAQNPEYVMGYKTLQPSSLVPSQTGTLKTSVYIGPKEQKRLKALEKKGVDGLALSVDYGWTTFLADPLFWTLSKIYAVVKNWGWAIIILTILIKLIFYPLSAASYRSMAKMKKLSPRIETLKERFADDKPQLQQAMMKLYKEEKINPAGGCLPMLVQMPVFMALYYVLLESVELRHAPFALWWQDLSAPDPYYVLPILMGLSMFLQQKLNPAPMEQMQKNIMMIMPLVLTFLFLTFPQGLVLYWVMNNILSMVQQWRINKVIVASE